MQHLASTELSTIVGGVTRNDQITQQLTTLQSTLTTTLSNTSSSGSNNTFMLLAMLMALRPQPPAMIAASPVGFGPAMPSSVINVRTRVRRW